MPTPRRRCFIYILYPFTCGPSPMFDGPEASKLKLQGTIFLQYQSTHLIYNNLANIALISMFSHVYTINLCDENSPKIARTSCSDLFRTYSRHTLRCYRALSTALGVLFINQRQISSRSPLYSAPAVASVLREGHVVVSLDHSRDERALPDTMSVLLLSARASVDAAVSGLLGTGATESPSSAAPIGDHVGAGTAGSDHHRTLVSPQRCAP